MTAQGLEVYGEASKHPGLAHQNYSEWITEARTGIDKRGRRSEIGRAAVPSGGTVHRKGDNVRQFEQMAIHLAGQRMGVDPSEIMEAYTKGSMKLCTSCGELKQSAAFHKDKQKADGVTSSCKICRKKKVTDPTA